MPYTVLANSYQVMCINAKAMPINNTNYGCHITAVELVYNQSYGVHIMPYHTTGY